MAAYFAAVVVILGKRSSPFPSITRTLISRSSIPFLSGASSLAFYNFASSIIFIEVSPFKKFGRVLFTFLRFTLLLSRAVR